MMKEFIDEVREEFLNTPHIRVVAFNQDGRPFGFTDMPVRREDHWYRTSVDGIPIQKIVIPGCFDWTMPLLRSAILDDRGKERMIAKYANIFQKVFRNHNLNFVTIDVSGVVEGHTTRPIVMPNHTWSSPSKFHLSTSSIPLGWKYYWVVSRFDMEKLRAMNSVWDMLSNQFVYIKRIEGSLFAFDEAMENAYPLYGLNLPELAGLDDGEIIGRPGHAMWFALASKILSRLAPEYGWVTGGEGYVRIHTQQPIYSPNKGWVSKGYDTFEMDAPLDGLSERLAIYGRSTKEVDYV